MNNDDILRAKALRMIQSEFINKQVIAFNAMTCDFILFYKRTIDCSYSTFKILVLYSYDYVNFA